MHHRDFKEIISILEILGERSCYDEGKRTAETLTMDYHRGAEVEVTTPMFSCIPLAAVIMLTLNMKKRNRPIFFIWD